MRTLLADDNSEIRGALRLLLRELGESDIAEARDMGEVLDACAAGSGQAAPDLILLDWELPTGSHPPRPPANLIAALRRATPRCRIIAMSARPEARQEALCAGCDAFISRTDPPDHLVSLLAGLPESGLD